MCTLNVLKSVYYLTVAVKYLYRWCAPCWTFRAEICGVIAFHHFIPTTLQVKRLRRSSLRFFPLTNSSPDRFPSLAPRRHCRSAFCESRARSQPLRLPPTLSCSFLLANPARLSGTSEKPDGLNYRRFSPRLHRRSRLHQISPRGLSPSLATNFNLKSALVLLKLCRY